MTENSTRTKIIKAAIKVIEEERDIDSITIRKIAEKASIAVGLINYHFKSKNNLINASVLEFINEVISGWQEHTPTAENTKPESILTAMMMSAGKFITDYPGISRVSIINDLLHPSPDDNSIRTLQGILPLLKQISDEGNKKKDVYLTGMEIVAAIQHAFLRSNDIKNATGFDFFNEKQRNRYIESLVLRVITDLKKE